MVVFNYSGREINAKIVYYGPGLSGKTTNLEHIYSKTAPHLRGKMVSMKTKVDRTLFFDFLPIEGGEIAGFNIRFLLYTVPGQVYYNATRKLVLKGADAIVFVADSQAEELAANRESLKNLKENLQEHGKALEEVPLVIQYNKRDLPSAMPIDKLEEELNPNGTLNFESVATTGTGVFETLAAATKMVIAELRKQLAKDQGEETNAGGQDISFGLAPESSDAGGGVGQDENDSSTIKDKVPDVPSPGEEPSSSSTADGASPPTAYDETEPVPDDAPDTQTATATEPAPFIDRSFTSVLKQQEQDDAEDDTLDYRPEPVTASVGIPGTGRGRGSCDKRLRIPVRVSGNGKPGHVIVNLAVDVEILVDEDDKTV
jgi:signal recognition particle receptor subunit beta